MHGDTPRVSEAAGQFGFLTTKKRVNIFVLVRQRPARCTRRASPAARFHERTHREVRDAQAAAQGRKAAPPVELCPNRNLYMLHVFIDGKSTAVARHARPTREFRDGAK